MRDEGRVSIRVTGKFGSRGPRDRSSQSSRHTYRNCRRDRSPDTGTRCDRLSRPPRIDIFATPTSVPSQPDPTMTSCLAGGPGKKCSKARNPAALGTRTSCGSADGCCAVGWLCGTKYVPRSRTATVPNGGRLLVVRVMVRVRVMVTIRVCKKNKGQRFRLVKHLFR